LLWLLLLLLLLLLLPPLVLLRLLILLLLLLPPLALLLLSGWGSRRALSLLLLPGRRAPAPGAALLLPQPTRRIRVRAGSVPGPADLQRAEQAVVIQPAKDGWQGIGWQVGRGWLSAAGGQLALQVTEGVQAILKRFIAAPAMK
jgi:hypothetical protein